MTPTPDVPLTEEEIIELRSLVAEHATCGLACALDAHLLATLVEEQTRFSITLQRLLEALADGRPVPEGGDAPHARSVARKVQSQIEELKRERERYAAIFDEAIEAVRKGGPVHLHLFEKNVRVREQLSTARETIERLTGESEAATARADEIWRMLNDERAAFVAKAKEREQTIERLRDELFSTCLDCCINCQVDGDEYVFCEKHADLLIAAALLTNTEKEGS